MNGTRFEQKSFTVPAVDKAPEGCKHGWPDKRGRCVLCGADLTKESGPNADGDYVAWIHV